MAKLLKDRTRARLEKALLYIDAHLSQNLSAMDLAEHAHLSPFHFQRLFSAYLGEPTNKYILNRRLERAAKTLSQNEDTNILELALDVGFETHSAFSKAFKQHFDITPSDFRASTSRAKSGQDSGRPYLLPSPGGTPIADPEIVELPSFEFQYRQSRGTSAGTFFELNDQDIGQQLLALLNVNPVPCINTISCFNESPQSLNDETVSILFGGAFSKRINNNWSDDWRSFEAGMWAVFDHWGDYAYLYQTWNRIYRKWLPDTGWLLRDELPFEAYITPLAAAPPEKWLTKIHIPIKRA
jgi:AraC family transcriptional regulator